MSEQLTQFSSGQNLKVAGQCFISGPIADAPAEVIALLNHPTQRIVRVIIEHLDLNDTSSDKGGFYWSYSKIEPPKPVAAESEAK